MFKELKYNLETMFRNFNFYFETVFMLGVITFGFSEFFKEIKKGLIPMSYLDILIPRMFLVAVFGLILMYTSFIISDTILFEKTSGRVEQLLSNGFRPFFYYLGSTFALSIVNEIMIILIFFDFYIFSLFSLSEVPITGLINSLFPLSFFNIGVSSLSCALNLKIRRAQVLYSVLFSFSFLIFFGANTAVQKVPPKYQSTLLIGVFAIGVLLFALSVLIARKLDKETIVLTIPG